jgi:hypothetical protein
VGEGGVYMRAADDVAHNARMCAGSVPSGVARRGAARCGAARHGVRYVTRGTEHVSIRPHNGNITAI